MSPEAKADLAHRKFAFEQGIRDARAPFGEAATTVLLSAGAVEYLAGKAIFSMAGATFRVAKGSYSTASTAVRSALANRAGKKGFTEVGYQFQKHFGRGGSWGNAIPNGATLNPATFNKIGYSTFKEVWRAPGSFKKVGGFIEKCLPDGRGIRFQENGVFKGFID